MDRLAVAGPLTPDITPGPAQRFRVDARPSDPYTRNACMRFCRWAHNNLRPYRE